jgi:periplasmic protein TonB
MKKLLIILFLMIVSFVGKAQTDDDKFMCILDPTSLPEFKGGMKALQKFLEQNLKYPDEVDCISGKVYVQFTVEKNGKVTNPIILKSLSERCDAEALRVVKLMPRWIPARDFRGQKIIKSKFILPIKFEIEE